MPTEAELQAILITPEAERTPEQKKSLADFLARANRPDPTENKSLITIEQAFEHPRFKQLVQQAHDAEAKAEALEKATQEAERKSLEEQNNYKALYEKVQTENASLKDKAAKFTEMEGTQQKLLDAEIASLPEQYKDIVPSGLSVNGKLSWLSEHKAKFMKPEAFDIGSGATGAKDKKAKPDDLTPEEKETAKYFGMSDEDYKKYRGSQPAAE